MLFFHRIFAILEQKITLPVGQKSHEVSGAVG